MENLMVQFKSQMVEWERLFVAAASQKTDTAPSESIVGENDSLIVRVGPDYWACPLSSKECHFLRTLLQGGGKMEGNNITKWIDPPDDLPIRNFLKSISRKLTAKRMPVRLHFVGWIISIEVTPS